MSEDSRALERALLDLAWDQWTALGVPGWQPRARAMTAPRDTAVDPEALILMTASLGDADPRLRDEATDWCVVNGRYLSKVRLKNLLRLDVGDRSSFSFFAATVNEHAHLGWPDDGARPRRFVPRRRSELVARGSPAAIRIRARLIFGVSARAELLLLFASDGRLSSSASELAERVNYSRRNVVEALDALTRSGLVRQTDAPGARRYAVADPHAMRALLGPLPARFIDWGRAFRACWIALTTLRTFAGAAASVRFVEAAKSADRIESELKRSSLVTRSPRPSGTDAWDRLGPWALELVHLLEETGPRVARA